MKVLIVDDHALTRSEMVSLVDSQSDLEVVGQAETGEQSVELADALVPDIVVMDIALPGINGIEATRAILTDHPRSRVLVLSNHTGHDLVQAVLDAGAMGYVRKDRAFEELVPGIRSVAAGKRYFGERVAE